MAQRFNPPPGWHVPAGFTPTPGWQPDPSWPAPPTGWNFWVDDAAGYGSASGFGMGGGYGEAGGYGQSGYSAGPGMRHAGGPGIEDPRNPGMRAAGSPGVHGAGGAYDPAPSTGAAGPHDAGHAGAHGNPYDPSPNTGQPGQYDPSSVSGSVHLAIAEKKVKLAGKQSLMGIVFVAVAVIINLVSGDRATFLWGVLLVGVFITIRGIVNYVKARKDLSAARAATGGGLYGTDLGGSDPGFGGSRNDDLYR
ncbi:hypothetical protein IM660_05425 [Ruania alkalisoli]|uniref:Uncharacterized protein n=1 Tax=Ruania alkalisoli TaxID=2779775 RepID=A0A7M1SVX7_9MICO|nr:hypothetical protein [Ruania alkalisoli]QOR71719.1 hypothetical protein IM660_05425 [Ruania alkalisoli]